MVGGMPFAHGDEVPAAGRSDHPRRFQGRLDDGAPSGVLDHPRSQGQGAVRRRGSQELHVEVRGDRARRAVESVALHQEPSRGPVGVAVQEGPADPSVQHVLPGLVVFLGSPGADHLLPLREALDAQTSLVGRAAAEATVLRGEAVLQALAGWAHAGSVALGARGALWHHSRHGSQLACLDARRALGRHR